MTVSEYGSSGAHLERTWPRDPFQFQRQRLSARDVSIGTLCLRKACVCHYLDILRQGSEEKSPVQDNGMCVMSYYVS